MREIAAAYIANLPTAAVSNNWLPRQVHIPPIMCITAPYTATQDGRDIVDDTLPLLLQIYLSPPWLPQRSFNEHVIDASSRYPFGPFHASKIDIRNIYYLNFAESLHKRARITFNKIIARIASNLLIASLSLSY